MDVPMVRRCAPGYLANQSRREAKNAPAEARATSASAPEKAGQQLPPQPQPDYSDGDHGDWSNDEHEEGVQKNHCPSSRLAVIRRSSFAFRLVGAGASLGLPPDLASVSPSPTFSG